MSEINLSVPYRSQWDSEASESRDDCGPAAIGMIIEFFKEKYTTNAIFKKTGAIKDSLISITQMCNAISSYGFVSKYYTNQTEEQLRGWLDRKIPVIALVHYGDFSSRQDKGFEGGHFFTVVGYRDDGFFINDPDFWGDFRKDGDHHFYTRDDFLNGWKNCTKDINPPCSYIIISPKEAVKPVTEVFTDQLDLYKKQSDGFERICDVLGKPRQIDIVISEINQFLTLEEQLNKKEAQITEAQAQIATLQTTSEQVKKENTLLQTTLADWKAEMNKEITDFEKEVRDKDIQIASLQGEIATLKVDVSVPHMSRIQLILKAIFGK